MIYDIVYFMNVCALLVAVLWSLFTGGWELALLYFAAYFIGHHFIGILTYPAGVLAFMLRDKSKKVIAVLVNTWEWIITTIWCVITITLGIYCGAFLSLNPIPTSIISYGMAISPFWRISDFVLRQGDVAFLVHTIMTYFVELSSILSILIYYFSPDKVQSISFISTCVFGIMGILHIFVRYKISSKFTSEE